MGARLGSPAQPHGQVLKTALPPPRSPRRQQPPSVIFHLIPLYSPPPIIDTWQRQGILRLGLPLFFCRATVSLWKSVSRKDRLNMHRRSQAAVNFHSPLPAAGLPASLRLLVVPALTSSVAGCAFFPHCPPRFPLPCSSCSQAHTPPKLHVRGTRGKAKEEAIALPRDFARVKGGDVTISHHFCKFPFPSEVCRCRGGITDGSSHHHVAEAAGIKLFTLLSC